MTDGTNPVIVERLRWIARSINASVETCQHIEDAADALEAMPDVRELVEAAWQEVRERLNREHKEGIISYRELKAGLNNAAFIRDAALAKVSGVSK